MGNLEVVSRLFRAIEQRDGVAALAAWDDEAVISEPSFLPYGGQYRGRQGVVRHAERWLETWDRLQGENERPLRAVFLDADDHVVAVWRLRATREDGNVLAARVVGVYRVSDGKIDAAQMFYSDRAAIVSFLRAGDDARPRVVREAARV
jgi:ketosteroid isomerase-like protein